ncbi:MAG: hypothetical protein ACYCXA_11910 [Actinomycetes bacterium]
MSVADHPHTATYPSDPTTARTVALAVARRAKVLWLHRPGGPPRAAWYVWHEGQAWLVGRRPETPSGAPAGPAADELTLEQQLPELVDGGQIWVSWRAKDTGALAVRLPGMAHQVHPEDPEWIGGTAVLANARLNAADPRRLPGVWADHAQVWRVALTEG